MAQRYSDIVDPQNIEMTVADDYQFEVRLLNSGILRNEGVPTEGTHLTTIKQTLFEGNGEGQAIGVDSEITLKNKTQGEFQLPIVERADGAEFDDIADAIVAKRGKDDIRLEVQQAVSRQSAQMADFVGIKILNGITKFIETAAVNFLDSGANDISLSFINRALATKGETATNMTDGGGFAVMRSSQFFKLQDLGLVAATSNTMGNMKQDEIVRGGLKGTLLGMNTFVTNKYPLVSGGDQYVMFLEPNSLRFLMAPVQVDPFQRQVRAFKDVLKFKIRLGGILDGISWSASKTNIVTNTTLATGTNYELLKTHWGDVPAVVLRTQTSSDFSDVDN